MRKLFLLVVLGSVGIGIGCGNNSGSSTPVGIPGGGNGTGNVLPIAVDGGPTATQSGGTIFANGIFASATICAPGSTSNCVTVDHLLVDTGSYGLRVLESEVSSLKLPSLNASNGQPAYDCVAFVDLSFLWGPVMKANVTLAGETASNIPIQVISSSPSNIPSSCSSGNSAGDENTQALLQANGILGVGLEPTDCFFEGGSACDPSSGVTPIPSPAYYTCSGNSCTPQYISVNNQVTNPVALFSVDNNGVIVELPSVSGSAATVSGSLIIGVGTQSNNQLGSANVYTTACNFFDTTFDGQAFDIDASSCSGPGSFIDSGSNGYFFPDVNNAIPICASNTPAANFYCPTSLQNLSASNSAVDPSTGALGFTQSVSFSVDNANNLFSGTDAALSTLGGPVPSGSGFDWGAPFFYGKHVFSTIDGTAVPSGLPATPWWAY